MQQGEGQEGEKDSNILHSLGRWARYGFAGVGVIASIIGLILVVFAYFTLSPVVGTMKDTTLVQLDNSAKAITDLDKSLSSASDALGKMPGFSENLSMGFRSYADSAVSLADGVDAIANTVSAIPGAGGVESLHTSASSLRSTASSMENQANTLSSISSSVRESQQEMTSVRADLSKAKTDLTKAKGDISGTFDAISSVLIMGCGAFALVFIALGAYSAALFL
jgi:uncharacterized phage infection (PIP) family protein YhgE